MANYDRQRFIALMEQHLPALYRAGYRLCRNRADAEDLVQDVCLRAYGKRGHLSTVDSPRAWLLRVQYNIHVDAARRNGRAPTESLDDPATIGPTRSADEEGPDAHLEAALLAETLSAAWPSLNKDQQALLALHAEGYSLAELTEVTGLPLGALKARLHRARVRLGKLLKAQQQLRRHCVVSGESL